MIPLKKKKKMKRKKNSAEKEKNKIVLLKKCDTSVNDLPKVLINYLGTFFYLDTLLNFSSTNKRHQEIFSEVRTGYYHLMRTGFVKKLYEIKNKKQYLKEILFNNQIHTMQDEHSSTPLHCACRMEPISLETIKYFFETYSNSSRH